MEEMVMMETCFLGWLWVGTIEVRVISIDGFGFLLVSDVDCGRRGGRTVAQVYFLYS